MHIDLITGCGGVDDSLLKQIMISAKSYSLPGRRRSYSAIQKIANLNERILDVLGGECFLVDMGAGADRRFQEDSLEKNNISLINVDHFYLNPLAAPKNSINVAWDFKLLPKVFIQKGFKGGVDDIRELFSLRIRENLEKLEKSLSLKKIGGFVFSHSLKYLYSERAFDVLRFSMNSLDVGGKIFVMMNSSTFWRKKFSIEQNPRLMKYHFGHANFGEEIYDFMKTEFPESKILVDNLYAPLVKQIDLDRVVENMNAGLDPTNEEFYLKIENGLIDLVEVNGREIDEKGVDKIMINEDQFVDLFNGERFLVIEK